MTFNKHFPHRAEAPARRFSNEDRAVLMRLAARVSTLMLVAGYILVWVFW